MRFSVRQRVFSLGDAYVIKDEQGDAVFQVKSALLSLGHKLDLLDMDGRSIAHVQQRLLSFRPTYEISRDGQPVAEVRKELFSVFHPRFSVEGPGGSYEIEGDWVDWNFSISRGGRIVAQVSKAFSLVTDSYGVEIDDGVDVPTILCMVIVIDEITHPDNDR